MVLMAAALTLRLRSGGSLVRVTGGLMFAFGFISSPMSFTPWVCRRACLK